MNKEKFFKGASLGVCTAFLGFFLAMIGCGLGFLGFYINYRFLSVGGFVITAVGILIGAVGVLYGWITEGKRAISGSLHSALNIQTIFRELLSRYKKRD